MNERYIVKRSEHRGLLDFEAPEEIEYERADPPTAKQLRQMAWLVREIDRYQNGQFRLDEHDAIQERIDELEFLLYRATPHDKRITPLTEGERQQQAYFGSLLRSQVSLSDVMMSSLLAQDRQAERLRHIWVEDRLNP